MYRDTRQMEFSQFYNPFEAKLDSQNRWVKWAHLIPWEELEPNYASLFAESGMGAPAKSFRLALGALIIKGYLGTSDEETIEQIRENPYLQYFLGFLEYSNQTPFDASMFVHFRKRLGDDLVNQTNTMIVKLARSGGIKQPVPVAEVLSPIQPNKGQLLIDATCAPADIAYPTDLNLLNDAREITESIIDTLHAPLRGKRIKPRDHRNKARKAYLTAAKNKNLSKNKRRTAIGKQLRYLDRNLKFIKRLSSHVSLTLLSSKQYKDLLVISLLFDQQTKMYQNNEHSVEDRIVSINQPHVRPIVRGKAAAKTEFGAKISASLDDGYFFLDKISWDNFNESKDLIAQAEAYKERNGHYPKSIHADKIYRNRNNLNYCKERNIRLSGPPLGRPPKLSQDQLQATKQIQRQDERDRIPIEGKFGQSKRAYGLNRIMTKLPETSACMIALAFLIVNLVKWLRSLYFFVFFTTRLQKIVALIPKIKVVKVEFLTLIERPLCLPKLQI
jgi:transposase, IS5 family